MKYIFKTIINEHHMISTEIVQLRYKAAANISHYDFK